MSVTGVGQRVVGRDAGDDPVAVPTSPSPRPAPVVGVLALQGAFAEHIAMFAGLGAEAREVRTPEDLEGVDALVIPGGESTTIGKLLVRFGLDEAIRARTADPAPAAEPAADGASSEPAARPLAVWGTCAGLILLARDLGDSGSTVGAPQPLLGLMDLRVRRNAFGTQLDSFEANLLAPDVADHPVPAVFIRAPVIEDAGPEVEVLARLPDGRPVAARQGRLLVTAFHPELTPDPSFHRYFLDLVTA
ncbi:MAG: Pyridoxal 5'-phosphate synthase (glutamine hydrolyzing), glutaminase subunit [uncultured Thermomicrobiales bacterium]|uniref:Pyridoxal 5'-phosphate synthase subunit PdxT n=1 Tax=uncultured Thermomicrobiales bacterium TaxID=1645740 RepID=A0A6J4TWU9_9BACT|nr:MAG: Pyridoxal 5'-phosphate synthase (glutamine hydrolyzing), glutaminase subunit [uncultured Thermomicrobiales bacterium]